MAVWYNCGNGMVRTKFARTSTETPFFLCCPGPSLADAPDSITGPNRIVLALNTAYPKVRPDMWIGMDTPRCYDRNILYESFPKFYRGGLQDTVVDGKRLQEFYGAYFLDVKKDGVESIYRNRAHDVSFAWQGHTLGVALHFLIWLGAREIHLVGCDMGGATDYHDSRVLSEEQRASNRRLYKQQVDFLRIFHAIGKTQKVEVISNTKDSPINEFMDFESLEASLDRTKPKQSWERLHAQVANNLSKLDPDVLTVACVLKSGGDYDSEYVQRLQEGVRQNLNGDYQFVCLTDISEGLDCLTIPLTRGWPGWWSKMELFRYLTSETLYLDLDTVVHGNLEWVRNLEGFTMVKDFNFPELLCSAVMFWDGDYSYLYEDFAQDPATNMENYSQSMPNLWGDQCFIADHLKESPNTFPEEQVTSYKLSSDLHKRSSSIVCFHGKPRPHEVNWKICGEPTNKKKARNNPIRKKWLVIGHPRSGTKTAAHTLQRHKLDVRHEIMGKDGISSWMYAVKTDKVPYHTKDRHRGRNNFVFERTIWMVREPSALFSSVVETECTKGAFTGHQWRAQFVDIDLEAPLPIQAAQSILGWSVLCEAQNPNFTIRVEDAHEDIAAILGKEPFEPIHVNTRDHKSWSWGEIEKALPQDLFRGLLLLRDKWGYKDNGVTKIKDEKDKR